MSVAAVVLAAGAGSRFSAEDPSAARGPKLLVELRGRPVVSWAVLSAVEAGLDEVVVVSGAVDLRDVVPKGVTLLVNDQWQQGQASSLQCGLIWCASRGHDAAVIGLGDSPGLVAQSWRAVADAPGGPIVFATYDGQRGHPVRLDKRAWVHMPTVGDEGARNIARDHPEWVSEVPCGGTSDDIDVPEDLERWRH